jgi:phosphatidylglycerophosphatase C
LTAEWPVLAAFDFDGTLTESETLIRVTSRCVGCARVATCLIRVAKDLALGRRDQAKAAFLACALAGVDAERLALAAIACRPRILARMRPQTLQALTQHRLAGHRVVVVSASPEPIVRVLMAPLGPVEVVATGLESDGCGRLTGRISGPNCNGAAKPRLLAAHLGGWQPAASFAYGDSSGDDALLSSVDHPVRVRRGRLRSQLRAGAASAEMARSAENPG